MKADWRIGDVLKINLLVDWLTNKQCAWGLGLGLKGSVIVEVIAEDWITLSLRSWNINRSHRSNGLQASEWRVSWVFLRRRMEEEEEKGVNHGQGWGWRVWNVRWVVMTSRINNPRCLLGRPRRGEASGWYWEINYTQKSGDWDWGWGWDWGFLAFIIYRWIIKLCHLGKIENILLL